MTKKEELKQINILIEIDKLYKELEFCRDDNRINKITSTIYINFTYFVDEIIEEHPKGLSEELKYRYLMKLVVSYMNYDNHEGQRLIIRDTHSKRSPNEDKINDEIQKALETLEKYHTPEYLCLHSQGFYNPFKERERTTKLTQRTYNTNYHKKFKNNLRIYGFSHREANSIITTLHSLHEM